MTTEHTVEHAWRELTAQALEARAQAITDCLDHLDDCEEALSSYPDEVKAIRELTARLRTRRDELAGLAAQHRDRPERE